jgi:hypothetical protein
MIPFCFTAKTLLVRFTKQFAHTGIPQSTFNTQVSLKKNWSVCFKSECVCIIIIIIIIYGLFLVTALFLNTKLKT